MGWRRLDQLIGTPPDSLRLPWVKHPTSTPLRSTYPQPPAAAHHWHTAVGCCCKPEMQHLIDPGWQAKLFQLVSDNRSGFELQYSINSLEQNRRLHTEYTHHRQLRRLTPGKLRTEHENITLFSLALKLSQTDEPIVRWCGAYYVISTKSIALSHLLLYLVFSFLHPPYGLARLAYNTQVIIILSRVIEWYPISQMVI